MNYVNGERRSHNSGPSLALADAKILFSIGWNMTEWNGERLEARTDSAVVLLERKSNIRNLPSSQAVTKTL